MPRSTGQIVKEKRRRFGVCSAKRSADPYRDKYEITFVNFCKSASARFLQVQTWTFPQSSVIRSQCAVFSVFQWLIAIHHSLYLFNLDLY
jgi:hypothetical protein